MCPTLGDPRDCSSPGFPVLHCLPEFAQIHVHWVGDAFSKFHRSMLSGYSAALLHPQENLFCGLASSAPSLGFWGCSEEAKQCLETWLQVPWSLFIAGTSIITWTLMSVWKFGFLTVASFACDTLCQTQIMTVFVLLYNTKGFLTYLPKSHLSLKIISTLGVMFFFLSRKIHYICSGNLS